MRLFPLAICLLAAGSAAADGDDLTYASNDELAAELESRQADIARTQARIDALAVDALAGEAALVRARADAADGDTVAVARAKVLYRFSRHGGSARYLLAASCTADFLKRLGYLKHLLGDGLRARREAGLRLAEAESRLASIAEEKRRAAEMLDMLADSLAEVMAEMEKRRPGSARLVLR